MHLHFDRDPSYKRVVFHALLTFAIVFAGGLPASQIPSYVDLYKAILAAVSVSLVTLKLDTAAGGE